MGLRMPGRRFNIYLMSPKIRVWQGRFLMVFLGLLLVVGGWFRQAGAVNALPGDMVQSFFAMVDWKDRTLPGVLKTHIPLMKKMSGERAVMAKGLGEDELQVSFGSLIGARFKQPGSFLTSQIPLLNKFSVKESPSPREQRVNPEEGESISEKPVGPPDKPLNLGDKPLVLIYSSHTGETYEATDGLARLSGKRGGVYQAARELAQQLEKVYGVKVIHSQDIFDTDYRGGLPYLKSGEMVARVLKENPSIQLVVDVHRDAKVSRENSIAVINNEKTARVMLVVGTNARSAHPNWMQNYAFAKKVAAKMKTMYPDLLRKMEAQRGRYNQHLHPRAILVEIGSDKNSTDEALRSARLVADVLAQVLKELNG